MTTTSTETVPVQSTAQQTNHDTFQSALSHWANIRALLRDEMGETAYENWVRPLELIEIENPVAKLKAPTRFLRDWVLSRYANRLRELWTSQSNNQITDIEIHVPTTPTNENTPRTANEFAEILSDKSPNVVRQENFTLSAPLDPRFTFENFVVGSSNELAFAAARRVAEAETVAFNPLFLYGGVGLGKTHLMHAIAWHIKKNAPNRNVLYLSAEKFMYQFIRALRFKDTVSFKEQFRAVDVLMIDDFQFIANKESTQEEFFHTFNALVDHNRQVIISADKSPANLEGLEERLRSRLGWGLVADVHPTTYELRFGILQAKAEKMKIHIPQDVLEFLAEKISSNIRELEGALNRLVANMTLVGRPITLATAQDSLRDLLKANDRRLSIDDIQKKVADHYNVRVTDMHSSRRSRTIARPRQVAMYLVKHLTQHSLPEIGRNFGGRDHTTVMHAVKKVEELLKTDINLQEDVQLLQRSLQG